MVWNQRCSVITFCVVCIDDEMKPRGIHAAFFHALRSILILLILHHTDTASLNRNLFFLLRFFLSNLSRGNLNCLDMALNLTHTYTYSHCHKHSYDSSHTLLPSHLLRCFVCFIPILQQIFRMMGEHFAPIQPCLRRRHGVL